MIAPDMVTELTAVLSLLGGKGLFLQDLKKEVEGLEIEDVVALEANEKSEGKKKKKAQTVYPTLNFVLTTYYKGTALEIVLKKLEEYLDTASKTENDINNI